MEYTCICGRQYEQAGRLARHEMGCHVKREHLAKEDARRRIREDDSQGLKHKASSGRKTAVHGPPIFRRHSQPQGTSEGTSGAAASASIDLGRPSTEASGSKNTQDAEMRDYGMDIDIPNPNFQMDWEESGTAAASNPPASSTGQPTLPSTTPPSSPMTGVASSNLDSFGAAPLARPRRSTRGNPNYNDDALPEGPGPEVAGDEPTATAKHRLPRVFLRVREQARTLANAFGVSRLYRRKPTRIPDMDRPAEDYINRAAPTAKARRLVDIIYPYPTQSSFVFNLHQYDGDRKTKENREKLKKIITAEDFVPQDINVDFNKIEETIVNGGADVPWSGSGWNTTPVYINVPGKEKKTASVRQEWAQERRRGEEDPAEPAYHGHRYHAGDLHHRSLLDILHCFVQDNELSSSSDFHWHPYEEYVQFPGEEDPQRVYGELYTSQVWLDAERELLASAPEPGCDLPRVIAAYMFWSDATLVAQFGHNKVWPIYEVFGNLSKYIRCIPSMKAVEHVAFIPSLTDAFDDFLDKLNIPKTSSLMSFCRRELFHAVWRILLDDKFIHAYRHGIVIKCRDGVMRRVYPRIFSYSADYPEKVLIATLRDMGRCPCPRCEIRIEEICSMGSPEDRAIRVERERKVTKEFLDAIKEARHHIYKEGYAIGSAKVEALLQPHQG